jgi:alpha-glucosidase
MDINIDKDSSGQQYLEYNTIGGVLDFYFFAGFSPVDVSRQYAEATGYAAMVPYWTFGFHQCKYGYENIQHVKQVVANYSQAGIPLEVMWGDIDYMDAHQDFTVDPVNYPASEMRSFIGDLHRYDQKYVMMVDPGILRSPSYGPYARGQTKGVFLKADGGSDYRGRQWAGEVVWPDWLASGTQSWWTGEIQAFFDPEKGLNVDGLWTDMNEASNFCYDYECGFNTTATQAQAMSEVRAARFISRRQFQGQQKKGLPGRDLFTPRYRIQNHRGDLSMATIFTNVSNADGTFQYDTHNMYGLMMANATRYALLARMPGKRPFVLSRSTFAGAGSKV